jgi:hypothetical protein
VRLDANSANAADSPFICVELSWDGGATWSTTRVTTLLGYGLATFVEGSAIDTWGHSWTPAELSDGSFVVRLTDVATASNRGFALDWVAVQVTYTP